MALLQSRQAASLTLGEIVGSPEYGFVEDQMREQLKLYRRQLAALDPMDIILAQKCTALTAKIRAMLELNRRVYEAAGLAGVDGERAIDG
jgi:hypothetical protein